MPTELVRRKLPAYGKALADARRQGLVPQPCGYGHVAVTVDWRTRATAGLPRLVCPPDDAISVMDFSCLAGLAVLLPFEAADAARAAEAVTAMLEAGAAGVWAWNLSIVAEMLASDDPQRTADLYGRAQLWHAAECASGCVV